MNKTIRIATLGIAEELRRMELGDIVRFPIERYNYGSIRATPSTSLVYERMNGKMWKTKLNYADRCVDVTRTA